MFFNIFNFFFQIQCLTHTHHLGIDTQLFVLSPILILILWKWPKMGSIGLLSLAVFSTGARFYVTIAHQLSNYVYFGASWVYFLSNFKSIIFRLEQYVSKEQEIKDFFYKECKLMIWCNIFSIKQLFRTADLMYSMPVHRATIYIFGIFTGYAMRMYKHVRLTKVSVHWTLSSEFLGKNLIYFSF